MTVTTLEPQQQRHAARPQEVLTTIAVWLRRDWLVLLVYALLALALMYPVPLNPRTTIPGHVYGDNVQFVYIAGWMSQALYMGESPFVDPRLNYPYDLEMAVTDIPYVSIIATAPLGWLTGPVLYYNILNWLFTWLSGYVVYLWLLSVTRNQMGAVVGGLAFLLTPYRVTHIYGHLPFVATWSMPLFFWGLDTALRHPQLRWTWRIALMVLVTFLLGTSSQYYLVMCLVLGALYALLTLLPMLRQFWETVDRGVAVAVGTIIGALIASLPYLLLLDDNLLKEHPFGLTRMWSLDPINFILPYQDHPLWGSWFSQLRPEPLWGEKTLYLSVVALILAGLAFAWRDYAHRWQRIVWLLVATVAAVLALGTDLHLNNVPVQADDPFWLPAYYLRLLPFVEMMRVWSRFGIITILFVALLAGVGAAWLVQRYPQRQRLVGALLCALVVIDLMPGGVDTLPLTPRPIDLWLAEQPGDFAVGFMPAERDGVNFLAAFGTLYNAKHMPAYNHHLHRPDTYVYFAYYANLLPDPNAILALRCLNLRYLILDTSQYDGTLYNQPLWQDYYPQLQASTELTEVAWVEEFVIFEFSDPLPDPTICPVVP